MAPGLCGHLYRVPPPQRIFFCGFPGCSPRHRAGNNPAKPRQHKRVVHGLYNPPRPRFRSRLRPSHLAPAPAVAYNQPGPGCSRIHPAKCVFQCGFVVGMVHLKTNTRDYLPTTRKPYTAPRKSIATAPNGGHTTVFASCPTAPQCGARLVCCQGACPPRLPGATTVKRGAGLSRVWPLFCVVTIL